MLTYSWACCAFSSTRALSLNVIRVFEATSNSKCTYWGVLKMSLRSGRGCLFRAAGSFSVVIAQLERTTMRVNKRAQFERIDVSFNDADRFVPTDLSTEIERFCSPENTYLMISSVSRMNKANQVVKIQPLNKVLSHTIDRVSV